MGIKESSTATQCWQDLDSAITQCAELGSASLHTRRLCTTAPDAPVQSSSSTTLDDGDASDDESPATRVDVDGDVDLSQHSTNPPTSSPKPSSLQRFWRRISPSRKARRRRLFRIIHSKMNHTTVLQYTQVQCLQTLYSLLEQYHLTVNSFSKNGEYLQRHLKKWDKLQNRDATFSMASNHLTADVDDFITRANELVSNSTKVSMSQRFQLECKAKSLTRRSVKFHKAWELHTVKKDVAKSKGNHCITSMTLAGKVVKAINGKLEDVVLDLVTLWKVGQTIQSGTAT